MDKEIGGDVQEVKREIHKRTSISITRLDKKMRMKVDVLDYTMEGVLSIECKDRRWRPVAFLSKSLNETERNYEIYDKEMLAVIRELENWRHLLEGTKFKFKVWINHNNLEYFMKTQKLNRKQAY